MLTIRDALLAADAPLTLTEIASGVYGWRDATRCRGGRRRHVAVPNGDPSNVRRALKGLLRSGTVVEVVDAAVPEFARRKGQTRYAISDRFTGNDSGRLEIDSCEPAPLPSAPPNVVSVFDSDTAFVLDPEVGDSVVDAAAQRIRPACAVEELTDEERVFLDFLADTAVGVLKERLARGESPDG